MTTESTIQQPAAAPADEEAGPQTAGTVTGAADAAHRAEPSAPADNRPEQERERGFPAGQLAAGGLSVAAALLAGLYQVAGAWGVAAAGATAGGGAFAYLRRRRRGRAGGPLGSGGPSGGRRTGRTGASSSGGARRTGGGLLGRIGRSGQSGGRSGGRLAGGAQRGGRARSGRSGGSPAGAARTGGLLGKAGRSKRTGRSGAASTGTPGSGRGQRRSGRGRTGYGGHGVRRVAGGAVRATGRGARRVGAAVRASGRGMRRAGVWADRKTGRRAGRAVTAGGRGVRRAVRAAGRGVRRAGVWADRRTGRRVSIAWAAARTGRGFRAARRAALAARSGARRWDAEATAGLVALVAWLTARWRRTPTTASGTTTETAGTALSDGDPAITTRIECPRCGATHKIHIPAEEADTWITCGCGLKICAFRKPVDPPDDWDKTEATASTSPAQHHHPSTAPTTTSRRTRTMSTFPLATVAAEMNAAAASHAPADMWVVARELDQLTEVPAYVALAIRTYTTRLQGEYPIDPAVVEAIHRLYQAQAQLVSVAEEIGPLFRRVHADDLKREEAPRTGEPLWNV